MTHIDPFAPADSPQHPSRWRHDPRGPVDLGEAMRNPRNEYEDGVPFWIALDSEPISVHDPESLNKSVERWAEYKRLLAEHGTDEQLDAYEEDWSLWSRDDMPTLSELRATHIDAHAGDEAMVPWLVLPDEPVRTDDPNAAIIGEARWKEYRQLLQEYGTDQQRELLDVIAHEDWPDEVMPTLAELREKNKLAHAALEGVTAEVKASATPTAAEDLEAKLAALKEAGL